MSRNETAQDILQFPGRLLCLEPEAQCHIHCEICNLSVQLADIIIV